MTTAMSVSEVKKRIGTGAFDKIFTELYSGKQLVFQKERYLKALDSFMEIYSLGENAPVTLYSAPGRTEVGGNHTDHQHGRVLAASVNLDIIAVVSKTDAIRVRVKSEGYREDIVDLDSLEVRPSEDNKAISFIRGTCARFKQLGYKTGGLVAYTTSQVLKASGLSSSAAFEVAIGTILNNEFNEGKVEAIEIAQIAQYAENVYFGKLSGLMDQMASSVGSFVSIDFADNSKPVIDKVNFDFVSSGYSICIVDSGSGHADVTDEYSLVTKEMKAVARFFDRDVLREVDESEFYANIPEIRKKTGDRAVLRAIHFFDDNRRAWEEAEALRKGDFPAFLKLIELSGTSSFMHLQNVAVGSVPEKQPIPLALALSQKILAGEGASRVHGGGFGGTIQAFVPNWLLEKYRTEINKALGENSCHVIFVRPYGGICISDMI